jgi:DNA repair protein RecO (recombination protein O)
MEKTYKTEGVILRRRDWRESDSLFDIYTRDYGKVRAVAIGAKKIKSKLSGHLATPGVIDLMLVHGRRLDRVASATVERRFSFDSIAVWNYYNLILEIIDSGNLEALPDLEFWGFLNKTIGRLELARNDDERQILVYAFCLKFFERLGYRPEFLVCAECGKSLGSKIFFSLSNNGTICDDCEVTKFPVSQNFVKLSRLFLASDKPDIGKLILRRSLIDEVRRFLRVWLPYRLEREVKSLHNIKQS